MKKTKKPQTTPVPGYCYILEGYLKGWVPADTPGAGTILKTSQDIVNDLESMVEIDTVTVANVMSQLGFRAHFEQYGCLCGWMMRQDPTAIHTIRPASPEDDDE